jgi:drug/metabolite transporter (DMT)-like permease
LIYLLGEIAALFTSVCYSAGSTLFTRAGQMVGSLVVNRLRLLVALIYLLLAHLLLGMPVFPYIEPFRWFWLSVSGVIGLAFGDTLLLQAFVLVGVRLSLLMMSFTPILSVLFGWLFLAERVSNLEMLGILLTVCGIAWVIVEYKQDLKNGIIPLRKYLLGLLLGLSSAVTQTLAYVTSKTGLQGNFPALTGSLVRMLAGALALWLITLFTRQVRFTFHKLSDQPRAMLLIIVGGFVGPFLGVTFSLVAIQNAPVGIASTLMALPPVFLLPVGYLFFKERIGWQAVLGTLLAIAGVAVLFLV